MFVMRETIQNDTRFPPSSEAYAHPCGLSGSRGSRRRFAIISCGIIIIATRSSWLHWRARLRLQENAAVRVAAMIEDRIAASSTSIRAADDRDDARRPPLSQRH